MASLTMTRNPQKFTLPAIGNHTINIDKFCLAYVGTYEALIKLTSGTLVQVATDGAAPDSDSGELSSDNNTMIIDINHGTLLHVGAGAGSEVINISVLAKK